MDDGAGWEVHRWFPASSPISGCFEAGNRRPHVRKCLRGKSLEFAAMTAEELGRLLDKLGDEQVKAVAVAKLEGLTNQEIATRMDVALRTVERMLGSMLVTMDHRLT